MPQQADGLRRKLLNLFLFLQCQLSINVKTWSCENCSHGNNDWRGTTGTVLTMQTHARGLLKIAEFYLGKTANGAKALPGLAKRILYDMCESFWAYILVRWLSTCLFCKQYLKICIRLEWL